MNFILSVISLSVPLLVVSYGALVSEYCGRMAVFMEGVITFSGFLTYTLCIFCGNVFISIMLTALIVVTLITFLSFVIEKFGLNPFIASLAINLFFNAAVSFLSVKFWQTRGVLTHPVFNFDSVSSKLWTCILGIAVTAAGYLFLHLSKPGLHIRITGSNPDVLKVRSINVIFYRCLSWSIAAFCASIAGSILLIRLSSFVPGLAGGLGWLSLAAVFLGRKKSSGVIIAAFVFAAAQAASNNIQNIPGLENFPSAALISLPYTIALVFILVNPGNKVFRK